MADKLDVTPPHLPGFLLGIGLGGFVDGIVLHQLLQWHHLLTGNDEYPMTTVTGLETNTVADGVLHVLTWAFVVLGVNLSLQAWRRGEVAPPWRPHIGMLLAGWGAFNLVEGLLSHQLLGLHHVRDDLGGPLAWDIGFLVFGALLVAVGLQLRRRSRSRARKGA